MAQALCPIVTSTADTGPGTLRDCITQANLSPNKEVITFDPTVFRSSSPGVIALQADLPSLTDPGGTEISGPSATAVIIDGAGYTPGRGLVLTAGKNVIRNLTVRFKLEHSQGSESVPLQCCDAPSLPPASFRSVH